MKIYVLSILLLISCSQIGKEVTPCLERPKLVKKTASFRMAYTYVLQKEGFYAWHKNDIGGETFRGIARNYSKFWKGWQYVDNYKLTHRLKWNDSIPGDMLKWHVMDHYLTLWVQNNFMYIEDQDIATYTFDWYVNSQYFAIKKIQETLNDIGYPTEITGIMDENTVNTINSCPKWEFLARLISNRVEYYSSLANRYPSQRVFLDNWISRSRLQ